MRKLISALIMTAAATLMLVNKAEAVVARIWAKSGSQPGTVKLGWDYRGGSCYIAYTESNQKTYKYQTEAACDNLAIDIAYLTPGKQYKFTVSQDKVEWSQPVYAYAAAGQTVAAQPATAPATADAAPATHEPVTESLTNDYPTKTYQACSADRQGSMETCGQLNQDERQTGKCGVGALNFRTVSGPNAGEITVYWSDNTVSTGQYHLVFGTESGVYTMGALNVGGASNSFTVRGLQSGVRYYFKLVPIRNGQPVGSSWEVSDVAR